jgi:tetratricopeptide (TPR) repeat protein
MHRYAILFWMIAALALLAGCQTAEQKGQASLKLGVEEFENNNVAGALEAFNRAIQVKPEFPEAYFRRGLVRSQERDFSMAIVDQQSAVRMKPGHAPYQFALGLAYLGDEQYDEAIREFNAAKQLKGSEQLKTKIDEMIAEAARMKQTRASAGVIGTVISGTTAPVVGKTWVQHGFLGSSTFGANHPAWSIALYLIGHLFAVNFLFGIWLAAINGIGRTLTEGEKSGIAFVALLAGVASYYLAWGYSYWGLWVLCVFWTLGLGGNMINQAPKMRRP